MRRVIIVVPAANQAQANQVAAGMDPCGGGANTFRIGLSPTGAEPASHYTCNTLLEETKYDALPAYVGILGSTGKAFDVTDGASLVPGASDWATDTCAGWTAEQCFGALGLELIPGPAA